MSDQRETIKLVNLETGKVEAEIKTKARPVRVVFSKDGEFIFATERDCGIRCYRIDDQSQVWEHAIEPDETGAESYASAIAISHDGTTIAAGVPVGPKDWTYLIDAQSGKELRILKNCGWKPWAVQFSSDDQTLFVTGWGGRIKRFDVSTGDDVPLRNTIRGSSVVTTSPTGDLVAFKDGTGQIRVLDQTTGVQELSKKVSGSSVILFSPDGKRLFAGGSSGDNVCVSVWDLQKNEITNRWKIPKGKDSHAGIEDLAVDPSGRYFAAAAFRQNQAHIFDTLEGKQLASVRHRNVYGLAISPNGETLVTAGWDKQIRVWEIDTGKSISNLAVADAVGDPQLAAGDPRMYGVRFSVDGKRLAACHLDGHITVWDATDLSKIKHVHMFRCKRRFIFPAMDFSPNGLWIAAGDSSGGVRLYDSFTGQHMVKVGDHDDNIYTVRFGADETRLVSGGGGVSYLWALDHASSGEERDLASYWRQLRSS